MTTTEQLPPIFQDVDGVLNFFPSDYVDLALRQGFQTFKASPNIFPGMTPEEKADARYKWGGTHRYRITHKPEITDRLAQFHRDGLAEIVWLTTWGSGANGELRAGLNWPRLRSAGSPPMTINGLSHTGNSGRWWKWECVEEWLSAHEYTGKFVWLDDHFAHERQAEDWARELGALTICTDEEYGLTSEDLDSIEEYLGN